VQRFKYAVSFQVSGRKVKRALSAEYRHGNHPSSVFPLVLRNTAVLANLAAASYLSTCFDGQSPCFALSSSKPNVHVFDSAVNCCLEARYKTWGQKTGGLPFLFCSQARDEGKLTAGSCLNY